MGLSRQAYYQGRARHAKRVQQAQTVVQLVQEQRMRQPRVGTRKLHHMLRDSMGERGIVLGRDAMFGVLRNARMLVAPRRAYHKTTNSHHRFRRHPNLLKSGPQQVQASHSEQVWVADITYLPMRKGFLYLVAVMDWFTRKVLAWRISNTLETDFCIEALNEAIHKFGPPEIMNTDQGSQFTSFVWTDRLKRVGTRISMDGKGRCIDNIFIERLWRSLKYECVYLHAWETGSQARAGIGRWITFYNHNRPHSAHGGKSPAVVYFNAIETDQQVQNVA